MTNQKHIDLDSDFLNWIEFVLKSPFVILDEISDASSRVYIRIEASNTRYMAVLSRLPAEKNKIFIDIAMLYKRQGLLAPDVLFDNFSKGYMLLTDLGSHHLCDLDSDVILHFYQKAILNLESIRKITKVNSINLQFYNKNFLLNELSLAKQWFYIGLLKINLNSSDNDVIERFSNELALSISRHKLSGVHRDYHSRNLIVCDDVVGVLDFQDSVIGSVFYDVASLLMDVYVKLDLSIYSRLIEFAYQRAIDTNLFGSSGFSLELFTREVEVAALQRHLKILGLFCKHKHEGKGQYMQHIPLTLHYVKSTIDKYNMDSAFIDFFDHKVIPAWKEVSNN